MVGYIIAFLIVIVIVLVWYKYDYGNYLSGFWYADNNFLQRSGVESMYLLIKRINRLEYKVFLSIGNVCEQIVDMKCGLLSLFHRYTAECEFAENPVWSKNVYLDFSSTDGMMMITDCDTGKIYAVLYKDNSFVDQP